MSHGLSRTLLVGAALATGLTVLNAPAFAELMIVGGDNKVGFSDSGAVFRAPGNDVVSIIDIGNDRRPDDAIQLVSPDGSMLVPEDPDSESRWVFENGVLNNGHSGLFRLHHIDEHFLLHDVAFLLGKVGEYAFARRTGRRYTGIVAKVS